MADVPRITLNNGTVIPQLGFGVYQVEPDQTKDATLTALEVGYRHIDTAQMYGNEKGVGAAVRESGLDRADVFVTSKLNNGFHAYDDAIAAFDQTMETLGLEYLDLFLVHWPLPTVSDYVETWRAMEKIYAGDRCRAIGVSNFQPDHLRRLTKESDIVPAVNQIEVHPYLTQTEVRAANAELAIATQAWSPIAQGAVLDDPTINEIAQRVGKSPAQVTLRWHLQRGDIVFPKSVTRGRVEENFDLFDFELSADDIHLINVLNRDERTGPDPDVFDYVPS